MDKELQKLINEHMPKRYYGHEARKYAGVIAKLYAEQQVYKNCNAPVVVKSVCVKCGKPMDNFDKDTNNCCDECWLSI